MNTQFGRSMMEMIGVLAIVCILSLGAIKGFQFAMMKYNLHQSQRWFELLRFTFMENCQNEESCTYVWLRDKIFCPQLGEEYCSTHPYLSVSWDVHTGTLDEFRVYLLNVDKDTCKGIVDYDWSNLKRVEDSSWTFGETVPVKGQSLTDEQKKTLKSRCPFPSYLILQFYVQ